VAADPEPGAPAAPATALPADADGGPGWEEDGLTWQRLGWRGGLRLLPALAAAAHSAPGAPRAAPLERLMAGAAGSGAPRDSAAAAVADALVFAASSAGAAAALACACGDAAPAPACPAPGAGARATAPAAAVQPQPRAPGPERRHPPPHGGGVLPAGSGDVRGDAGPPGQGPSPALRSAWDALAAALAARLARALPGAPAGAALGACARALPVLPEPGFERCAPLPASAPLLCHCQCPPGSRARTGAGSPRACAAAASLSLGHTTASMYESLWLLQLLP